MRGTRIVSIGAAILCLLPFPRSAWGRGGSSVCVGDGAVRTSHVRGTQKPRCRGQRGFCVVRRTLKLRMRTGEPTV
jgi:hypothetical protein